MSSNTCRPTYNKLFSNTFINFENKNSTDRLQTKELNHEIYQKSNGGNCHQIESRDISGNFKRSSSAKFETMISEPRPKQRKAK